MVGLVLGARDSRKYIILARNRMAVSFVFVGLRVNRHILGGII